MLHVYKETKYIYLKWYTSISICALFLFFSHSYSNYLNTIPLSISLCLYIAHISYFVFIFIYIFAFFHIYIQIYSLSRLHTCNIKTNRCFYVGCSPRCPFCSSETIKASKEERLTHLAERIIGNAQAVPGIYKRERGTHIYNNQYMHIKCLYA